MASVLVVLSDAAIKKYTKQLTLGAVLPIESLVTTDRSFATELSYGGTLYLAAAPSARALWLVAVLESPETSGIRMGDKRKPGWYAAINSTPVTDLSKLRPKLKLRTKPVILSAAMDRVIRELLDETDAPVIGHVEPEAAPPVLDRDLSPLERAVQYLAAGHPRPAIAALCAAWRTSRVPAFADLVDRATRLLPEYHRPLFERRLTWTDTAETSKIWAAAFDADPEVALPQLLLNLGVGGSDVIPARVEALAARPLDPRLSGRIVELLSMRPTYDGLGWWPPVIDALLKARDARTFVSLREIEGYEEDLGPRTDKLYQMAHEPAPKLAGADRAVVVRIESELARLEGPLRTEHALIDEITAHPDDDGPYLVYADWLIERGRPLGEYISLACQQRRGALSPAQARRLTILVELPYLCGAFDDLAASRIRTRERGIDRELSVYWSTQPRLWSVFAACPLVRALVGLRLVGTPNPNRAESIAELVRAAPALQRIHDVGKSTGEQIAKLLDKTFEVEAITVVSNDEFRQKSTSYDLVRVTRAGRSR